MRADGQLRRGDVRVNGFRMAYLETGPADGPLALCLHGFPDHAWTWQSLLPELAAAGYRAVAPWMRGYHPTEQPPGAHYHVGALVADAVALHERLGGDERAVIIGHDWGAIAAWGAAAAEPQRWCRVVAMAVPPGPVFLRGMLDRRQLRRSWYILFFQLPWIPERYLARDDFDQLRRWWTAGAAGPRDDPEFRERFHRTFSAPGTLEAALGYYRSLTRPWAWTSRWLDYDLALLRPPSVPALYLHGDRDDCVGVEQAEASRGFLPPGSEVEVVADAGHWVHLDRAEHVDRRIVEFVGTA